MSFSLTYVISSFSILVSGNELHIILMLLCNCLERVSNVC